MTETLGVPLALRLPVPLPVGSCEGVGDADGVIVSLRVPLALCEAVADVDARPLAVPELDCVWLGDPDTEGVAEGLRVPVPVSLAVCVCVSLGLSVAVGLGEAVSLGVPEPVPLRVPEGLRVAETDGLAEALGVPVMLRDPLALRVAVSEGVCVVLAVLVRLGLGEQMSFLPRIAKPPKGRDGVHEPPSSELENAPIGRAKSPVGV